MPRKARNKSETGIYHVILRGINRQIIFENREDGEKFLQTLRECKKKSGYKLYGYCLMNNHVHLLIKEEIEPIATIMKRIGITYVYWYNWKYERVGHLFQGRFKSEVVEDEQYLFNVLRYIHQNPIKAGIVNEINEYRWSSFSDYIDIDYKGFVDTDFILSILNQDKESSIEEFKEFHKEISQDEFLDIDLTKRIKLKDRDAIELIKRICKVKSSTDLQKLDNTDRNTYLKKLKEAGLSTRQIERVTGISRHIVLKA